GGYADARLALGQDINGSKLFRAIQSKSGSAFVEDDSGEKVLVTGRQVRGYPLWLTILTKPSEIYESSCAEFQQDAIIVALLTLLTLIALEHILRAEAKAEQKARQLQLTLEHMSQGIMLVTNEGEIPIINKRCGELLRLPKEMIDNPPPFGRLAEHV